ncbi:MAG TPA: hypothetical protein VN851_21080 [Thermoanaerobaculia bacterium]|nr:hypothetical protein [Thermoanaerobaculia bacterium]
MEFADEKIEFLSRKIDFARQEIEFARPIGDLTVLVDVDRSADGVAALSDPAGANLVGRVPPKEHQDPVDQVSEDPFEIGKAQGYHLLQTQSRGFEAILGFDGDVGDTDRVVKLLAFHQDLAPGHTLEAGEFFTDGKEALAAHPVPPEGVQKLHAGNPPRGVEMMIAGGGNGARNLAGHRLPRRCRRFAGGFEPLVSRFLSHGFPTQYGLL